MTRLPNTVKSLNSGHIIGGQPGQLSVVYIEHRGCALSIQKSLSLQVSLHSLDATTLIQPPPPPQFPHWSFSRNLKDDNICILYIYIP